MALPYCPRARMGVPPKFSGVVRARSGQSASREVRPLILMVHYEAGFPPFLLHYWRGASGAPRRLRGRPGATPLFPWGCSRSGPRGSLLVSWQPPGAAGGGPPVGLRHVGKLATSRLLVRRRSICQPIGNTPHRFSSAICSRRDSREFNFVGSPPLAVPTEPRSSSVPAIHQRFAKTLLPCPRRMPGQILVAPDGKVAFRFPKDAKLR